MILQDMTVSFKRQLLEGVHDFRPSGGDSFYIALYSSTADIGPQTTAYTTTGEISATGYTAGGLLLTPVAPAASGTTAIVTFSTATWSGSGIVAAGAMIYNSTPAHTYTNPSVMVLSFGMDRSAVSGVFTVAFPAATSQAAILRIQ